MKRWGIALAVAATVLSLWSLDLSFDALFDPRRDFSSLLMGLGSPDRSLDALSRAGALCLETLAIALAGTALGSFAGLLVAVMVSGLDTRTSIGTRIFSSTTRVILDALRAIPDFAWALAILIWLGPGPLTGVLAIAITVCGVLGRAYGQLLDSVPLGQVRSVERSGGSRIAAIVYGRLPTSAPAAWSTTLARLECSVRNASVIGVVGGGGLGAELFEELGYGRMDRVATLLLALIALTGFADLSSAWLRRRFAQKRGRGGVAIPTAVVLLASGVWLAPDVISLSSRLGRLDSSLARNAFAQLGSPQWSVVFEGDTLSSAIEPVALAWLSTLCAVVVACTLLPWTSTAVRLRRGGPASGASWIASSSAFMLRSAALIARAVPDVAWLLVLAVALRMGTLAAVIALSIHASGILVRLFTEAIDDASRRTARRGPPSTGAAWLAYVAVPNLRGTLTTHAALQGEANLRAAFTLGIVGAGGLGDAFHSAISYWHLERASALALTMVVLFVGLDRIARSLTAPRTR